MYRNWFLPTYVDTNRPQNRTQNSVCFSSFSMFDIGFASRAIRQIKFEFLIILFRELNEAHDFDQWFD